MSTKVPPPLTARVGRAQRTALDQAGALLRELGHEVGSRDPDYPTGAVYGHLLPRYFRGAYDDVQTLPHTERLEKRTRAFARLGGLISDRRMAAIRDSGERHWLARVQSIFDDVDVVITPGTASGPSRIGAYQRRGAVTTLALVAQRVPFQAMFNGTGQPAAVVPWALDGDGLPTSIQLVGRPFDEATLLSLAAQIENGAAMGAAPTAGVLSSQCLPPGRQLVRVAHRLGRARRRQPSVAQRPVDACEATEVLLRSGAVEEDLIDRGMRVEERLEVVGHHAVRLDRRIEAALPSA